MGKFEATRKTEEIVLPSGIKARLRSLMGEHQVLISQSDEKKRRNAIDEMLLDCIASLGEKSSLTMQDIEKLFSADRAYALFRIRQLSNKTSDKFVFDYEFPVDANGSRRKQRYIVEFNKKDFPARPYFWVWEKMKADYKAANKLERDLTEEQEEEILEKTDFPEMFTSYEDIREKYFEQICTLPESGVAVHWYILDGESEKKSKNFQHFSLGNFFGFFQRIDKAGLIVRIQGHDQRDKNQAQKLNQSRNDKKQRPEHGLSPGAHFFNQGLVAMVEHKSSRLFSFESGQGHQQKEQGIN